MPGILVRDIPDVLYKKLKLRAQANNRSLQQEVKVILKEAVDPDIEKSIKMAAKIRKELGTKKAHYSDSTELIREDRQR
jgi:plasmid stability protein